MGIKKKILTCAVSLALAVGMLPISVGAAGAKVESIGGKKAAFVSTFGKMTYEGASYSSFKTLKEAWDALGKDGGILGVTGNMTFENIKDTKGRGPLTVDGTGTKNTSNVIDFRNVSGGSFELGGDVSMSFLVLRFNENGTVNTNGYNFYGKDGFDSFYTAQYNAGSANTITYAAPVSFSFGKGGESGNASPTISLKEGHYNTITAGTTDGNSFKADTNVILGDVTLEKLIVGNVGSGTLTGSINASVENGIIGKLVSGPSGGKVTGNVTTSVANGEISRLVVGPESGASVDGNVVTILGGGTYSTVTAGSGTVSGKKVLIVDDSAKAPLKDGLADKVIKINGGICEPVYDGSKITGFLFSDIYGIPCDKITLNGTEVKTENGVYHLPDGTSNVSIKTGVEIKINKNAKYVAGYEDGSFAPQKNMTRAEAITLLVRIVTDEAKIKKVKAEYSDVKSGDWFEPYIGIFQKLGIISTIEKEEGTKICPNDNITRGEFVELLYNVRNSGEKIKSVKLADFSDVTSKTPYAAAINYAVSEGIVLGYEDGTFKADNLITRAEVVTMVNRFLGREPNGKDGKVSFKDVGSHWAKAQILAACNEENTTWTAKATGSGKYVLSGKTAEEYVKGLYEQSANLNSEAIREGVDVIAEQLKKDIINSPNTEYTVKGVTYYISEQHGSDDNDGLSKEKPFKTVAPLASLKLVKPGSAFLFERGGVYRGTIKVLNNSTYGAYGEGDKPVLVQSSKNYADPSLWEEVEGHPNVWKCKDLLGNVGIICFDIDLHATSDYDVTYGNIMNLNTFGFKGIENFYEDLQFYSDVSGGLAGTIKGDLFLYSTKGNPGKRFKTIEMGEKIDIIDGSPNGCTIDNLKFMLTGGHAIGFGSSSNITVTNCIFKWLGGSVLSQSAGSAATNYGNAVEIYGSALNYRVENCWMYQIYDTAVTHQRSSSVGDCLQRNIRYIGNLMEYVHWGIEFYNAPPEAGVKDTYRRDTSDVRDQYNVLRNGGYGWGSRTRSRMTAARLYCGSTLSNNSDEITEYNIFDRCAGYLINLPATSNETDDKNIYIQTQGRTLGLLKGGSVYTCGFDAKELIKKHLGDQNAVVIVVIPEDE